MASEITAKEFLQSFYYPYSGAPLIYTNWLEIDAEVVTPFYQSIKKKIDLKDTGVSPVSDPAYTAALDEILFDEFEYNDFEIPGEESDRDLWAQGAGRIVDDFYSAPVLVVGGIVSGFASDEIGWTDPGEAGEDPRPRYHSRTISGFSENWFSQDGLTCVQFRYEYRGTATYVFGQETPGEMPDWYLDGALESRKVYRRSPDCSSEDPSPVPGPDEWGPTNGLQPVDNVSDVITESDLNAYATQQLEWKEDNTTLTKEDIYGVMEYGRRTPPNGAVVIRNQAGFIQRLYYRILLMGVFAGNYKVTMRVAQGTELNTELIETVASVEKTINIESFGYGWSDESTLTAAIGKVWKIGGEDNLDVGVGSIVLEKLPE